MNWRSITLAGALAAVLIALCWLAARPYFGVMAGVLIGINLSFVASRLMFGTNADSERVRALIRAAYAEGHQAGLAETQSRDSEPQWRDSPARQSLRS